MESRPFLLLTGATGFVGFAVLVQCLQDGWTVRIALRNEQKLETILQHPSIKPFTTKIESIIVPDITAVTAYHDTMSDITHIIHTASPLPFPTNNPRCDIIEPSVRGTTAILEAASQCDSVCRVIITSSPVANLPWPPPATTSITPQHRVVDPRPEDLSADMDLFTAYRYSRILSLNATDAFVERSKPRFDVINVIPGFVHGKNALSTSANVLRGSNRLMLAALLGQELPPRLAVAAHIDDVVRVHVCALDETIIPSRSKTDLAIGQNVIWNDAWNYVQELFPNAVKDGTLVEGRQVSLPASYDVSDTVNMCGITMKTYRQMVADTVRMYLEVQDKDAE